MVYLFLADGFEEIEALTPVDILRRAGIGVAAVGVGGEYVRGAHGITVKADIAADSFDDPRPEMIVLPGGMPGTANLDASPVVDRALRDAAASGAWICSICAAPMIPGRRGLLRGRRAVCFPGFEKWLEGAQTADPSGEKVVVDGRFVTASGMGTAKEFSLTLVSVLAGRDKAAEINRGITGDLFIR